MIEAFQWFPRVADTVPCAEQGRVKIDRYTITEREAELHNLRSRFNGCRENVIPGEYTRLLIDGKNHDE